MKQIKVEIKGLTPLLMCSPQRLYEQQKETRVVKKQDFKADAELSAYRGKGNMLIIPSNVMYAAMIKTSAGYKSGKRSMSNLIAGNLKVEPNEISLGTKKYEIDIRRVVIQGKSSILCARARLDKWKANFSIVYDDNWITNPKLLKTILEDCGRRIGIMAYRPSRKGWFGTFKVTKWKA